MQSIMITTNSYIVTEVCCNCGMLFAMTRDFQRLRKEKRDAFYCPAGHGQHYTAETEAEKLQREVNRLKQREVMYEQEIVAARLDAKKHAKEAAALRSRAQAGVCPDCNRTFKNMARHMATKHRPTCEVVKPPARGGR